MMQSDLPAGSRFLASFAFMHGVDPKDAYSHATQGIDGDCMEVSKVVVECCMCRYLTIEQQSKALEFWYKHGIKPRVC
jgi:hypothetical protein